MCCKRKLPFVSDALVVVGSNNSLSQLSGVALLGCSDRVAAITTSSSRAGGVSLHTLFIGADGWNTMRPAIEAKGERGRVSPLMSLPCTVTRTGEDAALGSITLY